MAGLVDACSSADDHAYPDHWSGLATVYSGLQHQSFFPAAYHLLDDAGDPAPHPLALAPASALAWRAAGRRRCGYDFVAGLFHRPAGELFHLALPAGDHRREHLVLPADRFSSHGYLFSAPCGNDRACLCGKDSAHLLHPPHDGEPSHLAGHESSGVSCCRLSGQPLGPVSSQERR